VRQSNPGKYTGMADGFKQIARAEGAGALLLGLGPTFVRARRAPPPARVGRPARANAPPHRYLGGWEPRQWGYVVQGGCKFGFFEVFKKTAATLIDNPETTSRFKTPIYMVSSALAETIATVALCPFEAVRIKMVTQASYAKVGMFSGMLRIHQAEGVYGCGRADADGRGARSRRRR